MIETFVTALFSVSVLAVAVSSALLGFVIGLGIGWAARRDEAVCPVCEKWTR